MSESPAPATTQCRSEYAECSEGDRRCVERQGHRPGRHVNRAGFAWDDRESAESALRVIAEMRRQRDGSELDHASLVARLAAYERFVVRMRSVAKFAMPLRFLAIRVCLGELDEALSEADAPPERRNAGH